MLRIHLDSPQEETGHLLLTASPHVPLLCHAGSVLRTHSKQLTTKLLKRKPISLWDLQIDLPL